MDLKSVQRLSTYGRVGICLANFNKMFGTQIVNTLKLEDLENYQDKREGEGAAAATIDMEISIAKTMITRAFDNDKVDGRTVKAFRRVQRRLKTGSNARDRTLTVEEYQRLVNEAPAHLKALLITDYHTGMRKGELLNLRWAQIDWKKGFIRLASESTKEGRPKSVPMNRYVKEVLSDLPRAVHHDFVFTYKGNPLATGFRRSLGTACKNAGIPFGATEPNGFRFHDIRSTVKTNMLRAGVDKALRDLILGHSLKGMDTFYLKPTDEDLGKAMARYTVWIERQLAEAVEKGPQTGPQQ